jgi:hypothetical protein
VVNAGVDVDVDVDIEIVIQSPSIREDASQTK